MKTTVVNITRNNRYFPKSNTSGDHPFKKNGNLEMLETVGTLFSVFGVEVSGGTVAIIENLEENIRRGVVCGKEGRA